MIFFKKEALTLLELILVITILLILAGISLPSYSKAKERAVGREAKANLKLIYAAEKIYRMEDGDDYYPSTPGTVDDIGTINTDLHLALNETNWDYSITSGDGDGAGSFTAYAKRVSGSYSDCEYSIANDDEDGEPDQTDPTKCP